LMSFFLYTAACSIVYAIPSSATLRHGHAANEIQKRNVDRHLQAKSRMSEKAYLLEFLVDFKPNVEMASCKKNGNLLSLREYLAILVNESGRKCLQKEASRKKIPFEDVIWLAELPKKNRQLEDKKHKVDTRHLQAGYVWKIRVICNLCSPDNGDGRKRRKLGNDERDVWNAITTEVQRGLQSACNMQNIEVIIHVLDKFDV
jgi:hypothetical protein